MPIKHPDRQKVTFELAAAYRSRGFDADDHTLDEIAADVALLYDLANLDDPVIRTANIVGTLYREYRRQEYSDKEAMALVEATLRHGLIERMDAMDKFKHVMKGNLDKLVADLKPKTEGTP